MIYDEFIMRIFKNNSTQKRKKKIRILVIELILFRISTYFLSFNGLYMEPTFEYLLFDSLGFVLSIKHNREQ